MTCHVSSKDLVAKFEARAGPPGGVGLASVGLPIPLAAAHAGVSASGFDVDPEKPERLARGERRLPRLPGADIRKASKTGRFRSTLDFNRLREPDALPICMPTPLAGETDASVPRCVVSEPTQALDAPLKAGLNATKALINVGDTHGSAGPRIVALIEERGGVATLRDPYLAGVSPDAQAGESFRSRRRPLIGRSWRRLRRVAHHRRPRLFRRRGARLCEPVRRRRAQRLSRGWRRERQGRFGLIPQLERSSR